MKPRVYVGGTFDMFHWGHVNFLRTIKKHFRQLTKSILPLQGCHLIVAINSDSFCQYYKRKPVMNQYERAIVVSSCKYVDEWFIMDSKESQQNHIIRSKPDYIVMGSDWKDKDYFTQLDINKKLLEEMSCKMLFMEYTKGVSTTEVIERLLNLNVL